MKNTERYIMRWTSYMLAAGFTWMSVEYFEGNFISGAIVVLLFVCVGIVMGLVQTIYMGE